MNQGNSASQAGRRDGFGFQVENLVINVFQLSTGATVGEKIVVLVNDRVERAVPLWRSRCTAERQFLTPVPENMVPDRFQAVLWNWERTGHDGVSNTVTVIQKFSRQCVLVKLLVDMLGERCCSAGLVHRHEKFRAVLLQHLNVAVRQYVPVLVQIVTGNNVQRFVFREQINLYGTFAPIGRG